MGGETGSGRSSNLSAVRQAFIWIRVPGGVPPLIKGMVEMAAREAVGVDRLLFGTDVDDGGGGGGMGAGDSGI